MILRNMYLNLFNVFQIWEAFSYYLRFIIMSNNKNERCSASEATGMLHFSYNY